MEEENFMDSYEDNDEIREFVKEILDDETIDVFVDYHYYSDGKHKMTIGEKELQVNAWTKRKDLKEEILKVKQCI